MALILSGDTGVPASGMPTGSVIQTVTANYSTQSTTSNYTTFQDTGLTATITPTSATSKILVLAMNTVGATNANGSNSVGYFQTVRGATVIGYTRLQIGNALSAGTNAVVVDTVTHTGVDTPATTSPVTYKMQMLANDTGYTITSCINNDIASITLMEIKA